MIDKRMTAVGAKNARAERFAEAEFCNEVIYTSHNLEREAEKLEVDYDEIIDLLQSLLRLAFEHRDHKKELGNDR